jgi:hypothetical protein
VQILLTLIVLALCAAPAAAQDPASPPPAPPPQASQPPASQPAGMQSWFPRLRPGMWVEVEGALTAERFVEAAKIKIYDGELDESQIETYVASVDTERGTLMTTLGIPVVSTPKTLMKGPKERDQITFAFVGVDDNVEIEGKLQNDGTMLADEVEVEKSKKRKPDLVVKNKHEIRARIDSVDVERHRIVLMGLTVQLNDNTRNKTPFFE